MNFLQLLQLLLVLGQGAIAAIEGNKDNVPAELVADLQAMVASVQKYAGSDVTFAGLEAIRLQPLWPTSSTTMPPAAGGQ